MWSSIPLSGGESPLGLDPRVAVAQSYQAHNINIATSRSVGTLCHRFSSGDAVELFTTSLLVHLYSRGIDGSNGGVATR